MIDLFQYADFRQFLRDWVEVAKGRRGFSHRQFSLRAGLRAPGYLRMVIDGRRNLGEEGLERFMSGLKLLRDERLYFRNLVLSNQATTDDEKSRYEGRLALLRKCRRDHAHTLVEIRERIGRFRREILERLVLDFTPEEASLLAGQLLPEE